MLKPLLFLPCLLLVASVDAADATGTKEELRQLQQTIESLKTRLEIAEQKIDCLEKARDATQEATLGEIQEFLGSVSPPWDSFSESAASDADLDAIVLPENPSRNQVSTYISDVLQSATRRHTFSTNDPQVAKLAKIGPENLDVLFEYLEVNSFPDSFYIVEVVRRLATSEHKQLILDYLELEPELYDVVESHGWGEDARDKVLEILSFSRGYIPDSMLLSVSRQEDTASGEALVNYFAQGSNRNTAYLALKRRKDINLDEAVTRAWQEYMNGGDYDSNGYLQRIAAMHGHIDALEEYVSGLVSGEIEWYGMGAAPHTFVRNLTGQQGDVQEIQEWLQKNRSFLVFNPETKKYEVSEEKLKEPAAALPPKATPTTTPEAHPAAAPVHQEWPPHIAQHALSSATRVDFSRLTLPANPSKDDVRAYIKEIARLSRGMDGVSQSDIQVGMIAKVGPGHLDTLLELEKGEYKTVWEMSRYIMMAVERLIKPEHKDLVLAHLRDNQELVEFVVRHNWIEEARETLIEALDEGNVYPPVSWVKAVVSLKDPSTYYILTKYMFLASEHVLRELQDVLAKIPDFNPRDVVLDAWRNRDEAQLSDKDLQILMVMAACYGDEEAYLRAVQVLDWPEPIEKARDRYRKDHLRSLLREYSNLPEGVKNPQEWVNSGAEIQYDPATQKFTARS